MFYALTSSSDLAVLAVQFKIPATSILMDHAFDSPLPNSCISKTTVAWSYEGLEISVASRA